MTTTTQTQAPFDPLDPRIPLVQVIEAQMRLLDRLKSMSLQGEDKETVYIGSVLWLAMNGNIPRDDEMNKKQDEKLLQGWKQGHLYKASWQWERERMPTFPREQFCCMKEQDLEEDDEALEATSAFFKIHQILMVKIVQIIYSETEIVFDMTPFS